MNECIICQFNLINFNWYKLWASLCLLLLLPFWFIVLLNIQYCWSLEFGRIWFRHTLCYKFTLELVNVCSILSLITDFIYIYILDWASEVAGERLAHDWFFGFVIHGHQSIIFCLSLNLATGKLGMKSLTLSKSVKWISRKFNEVADLVANHSFLN